MMGVGQSGDRLPAVSSTCAVLIVDDHVDTADMLRRYLSKRGYECKCVASGERALSAMRAERPGCVILDQMMPGMTGLEVLRRMQAWPELRDIPVIFYSAGYEWAKQMEGEALGARGWFVKG